MLYIVTALKPEAQAFVDKYKLTKTKCDNFTLFTGGNLRVIVSGIGVESTKIAIKTLIEKFAPAHNDTFINIGICGANKKYKIGELIEIGSIIYKDKKYIVDENIPNTVTCQESEVSEDICDIADMESFGFYAAAKEIKNRYIYKVVSDHFEPSVVTKDKTKKLIFNIIDKIIKEESI